MTTDPMSLAESPDRRAFLASSAGAVATFSAAISLFPAPAANSATMNEIPIIDTHQHLWDIQKFKLPWLSTAPELARNYVTRDYLDAVKGLPVVKAVYMEVDVDPSQQVAEADHLIELSHNPANLTVGAVISGRPASDGFAAYIGRYRDNPVIKGVRQVLHVPETKPGTCVQPGYIRGVRLLGEMGKSFDLCMRPEELGDAVKLAVACPDTRFILDHCGNADPLVFGKSTDRKDGDKPRHDPDQWRHRHARRQEERHLQDLGHHCERGEG